MNADELADAISDAVNSGINPEEFREAVQRDHNALQRYMFDSVFREGIKALAGVEYTDRRNERVVEQSREIADEMGWEY